MINLLARVWRMAATALCFGVFGVGGVLLNLLGFPLLRCWLRDPVSRAAKAQHLIHHVFRFFVGLMRVLGVLRVEVRGLERLQRPGLLIVANHPSLIDVVLLISLVERASCVVKSELRHNFFMRGTVQTAGYLCNDSRVGFLHDALAALAKGQSLIVFPEGSRTPLAGALPLQRGAAHIALRAGVNITPVRIRCQPPVLTKGLPWYSVPGRRPHFLLEVGDDIEVASFVQAGHSIVSMTRQLTQYLADYFCLEIHRAVA
jgi:1-acyl-sn-glycerol-3-phosphate acyltransferase